MKAKTQVKKVPKKRIKNEEPIQPIAEISYSDIVKECENSWKAIENSANFTI